MPDIEAPQVSLPEKIGPIPTPLLIVGVGALAGLYILLRSKSGGSTAPSGSIGVPTFIGGGGGAGGGGGTTPPPGTTTTVTQASLLQAWVDAQRELANLTTDPQKKQNRLGGSWTDILQFLNTNPNVFAGPADSDAVKSIRNQFLNVPASLYGWIVGVSLNYQQAKDWLIQQSGNAGYFRYMTLPDLITYLRLNPQLGIGQAWREALVNLPLASTSSSGIAPTIAPSLPGTPEPATITTQPLSILPQAPSPETPSITPVVQPTVPTPPMPEIGAGVTYAPTSKPVTLPRALEKIATDLSVGV